MHTSSFYLHFLFVGVLNSRCDFYSAYWTLMPSGWHNWQHLVGTNCSSFAEIHCIQKSLWDSQFHISRINRLAIHLIVLCLPSHLLPPPSHLAPPTVHSCFHPQRLGWLEDEEEMSLLLFDDQPISFWRRGVCYRATGVSNWLQDI